MQTKTIQRNIKNKLEEWLNTITDTNLRERVKQNCLVSGGSITSMFLGEPVNDYDVYIKDMNVLKKLVVYYTKDLTGVEVLDGREKEILINRHIESRKPFRDQTEKEIRDDCKYKVALDTLHADQIKLYFYEHGQKRYNVDKAESELNYNIVYLSPNAISLSNDIQIVIRFHGDNEQIHKTFDFVHATNYFTFEKGLVTNIKALESILTKQLKYQGSLYPVTSIIRMKKFIKRGWNINAGEILKIIFQCSQLNLKDIRVLEEQLIGVDVAYFETLINILRNIEDIESKLSSSYLNTIIDKVFDAYDSEDDKIKGDSSSNENNLINLSDVIVEGAFLVADELNSVVDDSVTKSTDSKES